MRVFQEDMWAVPVSASQGYTPETSDLQQLIAIDSKLRLFQPAVELPSLQRSYALVKEVCFQQNHVYTVAEIVLFVLP